MSGAYLVGFDDTEAARRALTLAATTARFQGRDYISYMFWNGLPTVS